jgi:hypothetical protein
MPGDSPRSTHSAEASLGNSITRVEPRLTPTGRPATFRAFLGQEPTRVEGQIGEDIPIAELSAASAVESPRVVAVTKKNRTMHERIGSKIGKWMGRTSTGMSTQKGLDVDLDKFEGTCLDGIALSVGEVGMVKRLFREYAKGSTALRDHIALYCEMRDALLARDPAFGEKYQNLYQAFLDASQIGDPELYTMTLNSARTLPIARIVVMNRQNPANTYALLQNQLVTRTLDTSGTEYDEDGMVRQEKPGERGGKSRRRRSRRNRNRKSNKKYKGGKRTKKCRRSRR